MGCYTTEFKCHGYKSHLLNLTDKDYSRNTSCTHAFHTVLGNVYVTNCEHCLNAYFISDFLKRNDLL